MRSLVYDRCVTDELISEFKNLYLKTADEYLISLKKTINTIGGSFSDESFKSFFMASHSLKSQSLAMNYSNTGSASRALELFAQIHIKSQQSANQDEVDIIRKVIDFIEFSLSSIRQTGHEQPLSEEQNNMLLQIQNG